MPLTCGSPDHGGGCLAAKELVPERRRYPGGKEAAPAGGESGGRAHGPALGGRPAPSLSKLIRISFDKDGAGLPPRAGPCARPPLSPPAGAASFPPGYRLRSG